MPPRDEELLVRIADDIGQTKEGIKNLKEGLREVKNKLDNTVKQVTCDEKHEALGAALSSLKDEIVKEIKKTPTGMNNPALTPEVIEAYRVAHQRGDLTGPFSIPRVMPDQPLTVADVEQAIEEHKEEKFEKRKKAITFWLATISGLIGLIGSCSVVSYKAFKMASKLEASVEASSKEIKSEFKRNNSRQVVYVQVPIYPDARVVEPAVPPRRLPGKAIKKR